MVSSLDQLKQLFIENNYCPDDRTVMAVFLALKLKKPLLVEGPAGVGKTELAKVISKSLNRPLIRLQCYEGLDESKALFEWNYQKQLLYIQTLVNQGSNWQDIKKNIFSEEFYLARPILQALTAEKPVVLLIDEIDKSDQEFESFLLEALAEYQVTIPEIGTIKAKHIPFVLLTSNNTRAFSEALKRRCLHLYIDYPDKERELEIILRKLPDLDKILAEKIITFTSNIRKQKIKKSPSIAEVIEWAQSALVSGQKDLNIDWVQQSLCVLLKYEEDIKTIMPKVASLL